MMMLANNAIQTLACGLIPHHKKSPSGWLEFNCAACVYNGETKPDTRKRMGLMLGVDGAISYHCFRCGFKASWSPGTNLSFKLKQLWSWQGANPSDIAQMRLECLKIMQLATSKTHYDAQDDNFFVPQASSLPKESKSLVDWLESQSPPKQAVDAALYLEDRNPSLLKWYSEYLWSPEHPNYVLMPIKYHNYICGWVGRLIYKNKNSRKYLLDSDNKFVFNSELLYETDRSHVILVEGPFDAISLSGVAIMGNQVSNRQLQALKESQKKIVVLPDRDPGGQVLISEALDNGWSVSFPETQGLDIKDGADLVNYFGRFTAIKMIFDSMVSNPIKIQLLARSWK